jgi:nucleoside 2-deoxyribosyltransferase
MRVYLAGPMRGIPEYNFPAFHSAAARLRSWGHEVWSPAENDVTADGFDPARDAAQPMKHYMERDLPEVYRSDAVAVLPGWRDSAGARLEVYVAEQCGIPVLDADTLQPVRETVCQEAQRLVYGDRGATYGHTLDDFTRTALMWAAILGGPVTAEQVALCMVALKLSRETYQPKRDNRTDICGYAECLDRIVAERERRAKALTPP